MSKKTVGSKKRRISISNSELTSFLTCRLKWKYCYKDLLAPLQNDEKLRIGSAVHVAIADWFTNKEVNFDNFKTEYFKDFRPENITEDLISEYSVWVYFVEKLARELEEMYKDTKVLFTEKEMNACIPRTGFRYFCKIDGGVLINNTRFIMEHKTASSFDSDYLFNLQINNQPTGYLWCANRLEKSLDKYVGIVYNIILKPPKIVKDKFAWIDKKQLLHREIIMRNKNDISLWLKTMRYVFNDMSRAKIYKSPSPTCSWSCPYKRLCIEDNESTRLSYRKKSQKYEQYRR